MAIRGELEDIRAKKLEAKMNASGQKVAEGPIMVTDENFDEVVGRESVVVVDFWAPWCMPCKMLGPVLEDLADRYSGRITVAKMNTDKNSNVPGKFGIQSIPTLIFFKDGVPVEKSEGVVPLKTLVQKVEMLLD